MKYKSGTLFFIVTFTLIIMIATVVIKSSQGEVKHYEKKYFRQKKIRTKDIPYFDRDILQANQHSWHSNHKSKKYMKNIGHFRPRHPHHAL